MKDDLRWANSAIDALQEVCEHMLITELSSAAFIMRNTKRVTLKPSDMKVVQDIRYNSVGYRIHQNESVSQRPQINYPNRPVRKRQGASAGTNNSDNNPPATTLGSSNNNARPGQRTSTLRKGFKPNWDKQSTRYKGEATGSGVTGSGQAAGSGQAPVP